MITLHLLSHAGGRTTTKIFGLRQNYSHDALAKHEASVPAWTKPSVPSDVEALTLAWQHQHQSLSVSYDSVNQALSLFALLHLLCISVCCHETISSSIQTVSIFWEAGLYAKGKGRSPVSSEMVCAFDNLKEHRPRKTTFGEGKNILLEPKRLQWVRAK